jgi:hypothetical protein
LGVAALVLGGVAFGVSADFRVAFLAVSEDARRVDVCRVNVARVDVARVDVGRVARSVVLAVARRPAPCSGVSRAPAARVVAARVEPARRPAP